MVEEEKIVEAEEVEEVKEEKPTSAMSEEEMHVEVIEIRVQQNKTLKFMIMSIAFMLGAVLMLPGVMLMAIPYIGWLIGLFCSAVALGLVAAGLVFTVFRIINAIKLLQRTKDFTDPNGYLTEEDKNFVKGCFIFSIVAIIV